MEIKEILLAKCINNIDPWGDKKTDLVIGKLYKVDEIHMGQSYTTITIDNKSYNSVMFEFYDEKNNEINIYKIYNPYMGFYIKKEDAK